jgi:hypothetical protein
MTGLGVVALIAAFLIGSEIAAVVTGCGSVDPTDPANYTTARIVNDTANSVVVDDCAGTYCSGLLARF